MTRLQHIAYLEGRKDDLVIAMAKAVIANDTYLAKCLQSAVNAKEEEIAKEKKMVKVA